MAQANARTAGGPLGLLLSSVGLKAIMAVTGAALVGFLVAHLAGNLLIFAGPELGSSCRSAPCRRDACNDIYVILFAFLCKHFDEDP